MRVSPDLYLRPAVAAQLLVVLVGIPGSGKSTFARQVIADTMATPSRAQWAYVGQPSSPTSASGRRRKCIKEAERALGAGEHVLIDRCNIDEEQRAHWLGLRGAQFTHRVTVVFDVRKADAMERVLRGREPREATVEEGDDGGEDASAVGEGDGDEEKDGRDLAAERKLWGIVKQAHEGLRRPRMEEGFHEVLVCRYGDQGGTMRARRRLNALLRSADNYYFLGPGRGGEATLDKEAKTRKALEEFRVPPLRKRH